ncbi:MAG: 3-deoxy-manno-octulosonate cytidylyltransferase [Candidatus Aureabacteria bacterium]|nr:3-deoxy-manno-octulosonate cytidylyltransferase [Candidatus Auribacterota bacterium]
MLSAVGIIPARYGSSRLPGKALEAIGGKPLVQLVCESAMKARCIDRVVVATDDQRIVDAVTRFGGKAVLTSPEHRSGSDRIAEAAAGIDCDIVVNIQGDEPMIRGETIDAVVSALVGEPLLNVATVATPLTGAHDADDPNIVKVVRDLQGNALYFSRARIPYTRDDARGNGCSLKHIGLYAYRKEFLLRFTRWPQTELELREKLEQLRILEHGVSIRVLETPYDSIGVDTPEDLERVRKLLEMK